MKREKIVAVMICAGVFLLSAWMTAGCSMGKKDPTKKVQDLEYTVLAEENIPEEILREARMRREKEFKLTFSDGENLYVCVGYGKQDTGGYSIRVPEFYEAGNGIYVSTELMGPKPGQDQTAAKAATYPYIVLKTEYRDKPVVFL